MQWLKKHIHVFNLLSRRDFCEMFDKPPKKETCSHINKVFTQQSVVGFHTADSPHPI